MIDLLNNLKSFIEKYIIGEITASPITAGQDKIPVSETCQFIDGEWIIIYPANADSIAHERQVIVKPDNVLFLSEPITENIDNPLIQKRLPGGQYCQGVYLGNPPQVMRYPAITIDGSYITEPLASGGLFQRIHNVEFAVNVSAETWDKQYADAWRLASKLESALGLSTNPVYPCHQYLYYSEVSAIQQDSIGTTLRRMVIDWQAFESYQRFKLDMPVNLEIGSAW